MKSSCVLLKLVLHKTNYAMCVSLAFYGIISCSIHLCIVGVVMCCSSKVNYVFSDDNIPALLVDWSFASYSSTCLAVV